MFIHTKFTYDRLEVNLRLSGQCFRKQFVLPHNLCDWCEIRWLSIHLRSKIYLSRVWIHIRLLSHFIFSVNNFFVFYSFIFIGFQIKFVEQMSHHLEFSHKSRSVFHFVQNQLLEAQSQSKCDQQLDTVNWL